MLLIRIKTLAALLVVLLGAPAYASVVAHLHEEFASGAVYNGDLTFADNYAALLSANGALSGTGYGVPLAMNFVWLEGVLPGKNQTDVPGRLNDWLADGPLGKTTIGIVWEFPSAQLVLDLAASNAEWDTAIYGTSYFAGLTVFDANGAVITSDAAVRHTLGGDTLPPPNRVPEPGSILLLGTGIAALFGMRRRKAA
ncbi:MAG: sorting protein [Herminiimonas sp.]|nr:sorting protein [Herminiimonas sp.]